MDRTYPKVSIIIINYNGRKYLPDCLSSLTELDYPKNLTEYILVDNGSRDGSVKYVQNRFPDVQVLGNSCNKGFAEANNQAARAAKGEILAFLNNDMRVHPLWLRKLVDKFIESSEDVACVSSKILTYNGDKIDFIGGGFTPFGISFQVDFGKTVEEVSLKDQNEEKELLFGCGGAMAIRKDIYLGCGGFDEEFFAYLEDVDLGWRLRIMGYRILYAPESIAFHKHKGTGGKIPPYQLEFMFERNRLLTIIKNTEDVYLPYFLTMVSIFNISRTFLSSMANTVEFCFIPFSQEGLSPETHGSGQGAPSIGRKLSVMWKKRDFGIIGRWFIRKSNRFTRYIGYKLVPQRTLSCSAAFNSIIPELSSLILKRKDIQSKRKISDRQIFHLFLMDQYPKQAIAQESIFVIEKIMEFEKEIMKRNKVYFPE